MNTQKFEIIAKAMNLDIFYNYLNGETLTDKGIATVTFNSKKQQKTFLKKTTDSYNHYNCEEAKNKAISMTGDKIAIDIELQ